MFNAVTIRQCICKTSLLLAMLFASTAVQAELTITPVFIGGEAPPMSGDGNLQEIFGVAAQAWEDAFADIEDDWELTIEYGWANNGEVGDNWGRELMLEQGGSNPVRITKSRALFNATPQSPGFYADPSPLDNSEFPIPVESSVPDYPTLNNTRAFRAEDGEVAGRIDLLTIAIHEIGHAMGLDEDYVGFKSMMGPDCQQVSTCQIQITPPRPYADLVVVLARGPHLDFDPDNGFYPLMIADPANGLRQLISGLDILILQQIAAVLPARTTFEVSTKFTDGNPADVQVTLTCDSGTPRVQSEIISASQGVTFEVLDFNNGELGCSLRQRRVNGYLASYNDGATGSGDCVYPGLVYGIEQFCEITNLPIEGFEPIPTLSQYGLTIMAMVVLMLGYAGFRRRS